MEAFASRFDAIRDEMGQLLLDAVIINDVRNISFFQLDGL